MKAKHKLTILAVAPAGALDIRPPHGQTRPATTTRFLSRS